MSAWHNISLDVDDGVALLTVRRPQVLNALSWGTMAEIAQAARQALADASVQGLILTSEGGALAGADIKELATVDTAQAGEEMCQRGYQVLEVLEHSAKPVVAAVNGPVLGGGCEISMACHARVVGPKLLLGQPEVNLGIIPGYGGTQRLPRWIGVEHANDLLRSGRPVKAAEACAWGWAQGEPVDDVVAGARRLIRRHLSGEVVLHAVDAAPLEVPASLPELNIGYHSRAIDAILVQVMREGWGCTLAQGLQIEARGFGRCIETEDMKIGMKNFIENGPRAQAVFVHG
ncbi:MAG: enoyl-CoA hydratase/isomerase family protein [Pseudomonadota bacterium]